MNLSKMISKLMNKNIKPKINLNFKKGDRKKNREIYNRICDVSLAKKLLNFKPRYSMKESILETIKENKNFENW